MMAAVAVIALDCFVLTMPGGVGVCVPIRSTPVNKAAGFNDVQFLATWKEHVAIPILRDPPRRWRTRDPSLWRLSFMDRRLSSTAAVFMVKRHNLD
jgi:hypothetical protein